MSKLKNSLRLTLVVLLAVPLQMKPQTPQSDATAPQVPVKKSIKPGTIRSGLTTTTIPAALPVLCFQPGVGWQRTLSEQPALSATKGPNTPIAQKVGLAGAQGPSSGRLPGAKQARSTECAGLSADQQTVGATVEKSTNLKLSATLRSAGSTKGALNLLQPNSPYHALNNAAPENGKMTSGATPSKPAGPDANPDHFDTRTFHAYISSIKMRRLIRNAPDFRTRVKLQELESNPATHSHKTTVDTKKATTTRHAGQRTSPPCTRRFQDHNQPRDPRTFLSSPYR
jgi:hypothetical protein